MKFTFFVICFCHVSKGADVKGRWNDIYEVVRPHIGDHITTFNDNHILLACLGSKNEAATREMMKSIKDYVE